MLHNPCEDVPMRSIDGDLLYHDLVNFHFQCKDFVTYAEEKAFNAVKNWTIAKLKNECEKLINMFNDSQNSKKFSTLFEKLKRSKKLQ